MAKHKTKKKKKPSKRKPSGGKHEGTHLEQNRKMNHKDFPEFLRKNFEEAGKKINQ